MMRVLCATALACALTLTIACDDSPTDPSETTVSFGAQLSPANEVPAVTGPEASGSGSVNIDFNVQRDSGGAITSASANFQVNLSGFPTDTALTMSHIHRGVVGQNGDIVVNTGLTTGEVVLTTGTGAYSKNGIAVTPALAQEIISSPASFYFNVHSVLNGSGVARGQLTAK